MKKRKSIAASRVKQRVQITLSAPLLKRARKHAHENQESFSNLVERASWALIREEDPSVKA